MSSADAKLRENIYGILGDLVYGTASVQDLKIAAKAFRLGESMEVDMAGIEGNLIKAILQGGNVHRIDFLEEYDLKSKVYS